MAMKPMGMAKVTSKPMKRPIAAPNACLCTAKMLRTPNGNDIIHGKDDSANHTHDNQKPGREIGPFSKRQGQQGKKAERRPRNAWHDRPYKANQSQNDSQSNKKVQHNVVDD